MIDEPAFFTIGRGPGGDIITPLPPAAGNWGAGRLRGMAVSGILARAAERALPVSDLRPIRWTLDLCRRASMDRCDIEASVIRTGRRLALVEANLLQREVVVATGRALFLRPDAQVRSAAVWAPTDRLAPPPAGLAPATAEPRVYYSEGIGWTSGSGNHQVAAQKALWLSRFRVVEDEVPTPFQYVASAADVASAVINWGEAGMQFINADLTLSLARLPVDREIGFAAADRVESDGISSGVVSAFDRAGTLGSVVVGAVFNAGVTVDPRAR